VSNLAYFYAAEWKVILVIFSVVHQEHACHESLVVKFFTVDCVVSEEVLSSSVVVVFV
jgi:hypothetical protein